VTDIFWDVAPYNLESVHLRFGGTNCLHVQSRKVRQASNQQAECSIDIRVLFYPEVGGTKFHEASLNLYQATRCHVAEVNSLRSLQYSQKPAKFGDPSSADYLGGQFPRTQGSL
jgi:hypothetical protein